MSKECSPAARQGSLLRWNETCLAEPPTSSPCTPQPCYKWWEPPYFWAGLRAYDLIAGSRGLEWCRYLTPSQVHAGQAACGAARAA
jgi:hypothetical protein